MEITSKISRRDSLFKLGLGATAFSTGAVLSASTRVAIAGTASDQAMAPSESPEVIADRVRRMKWWNEARFGMFIHWGLYSILGRHEWAMLEEGIPVREYEQLAKQFKPRKNAARAWAKLAKRAGQKYMVMTSKHHEGFCNFASKLTDYCAPKQGPGRDLLAEYVEAARAEGLRVGFYYSLMDWHHPDGARCAADEQARRRFVDYTHGLVHELMSNYGKVDILWYDVNRPLTPEGWEAEKMNKMVFSLQPDIIINNRTGLAGDFSTPEQRIEAAAEGRAWETCMTMNDSWGYQKADDDWKSTKRVIRNLVTCCQGGGNFLLNIGPKADGSIPEESVRTLTEVGQWMDKHGEAIYGTVRSKVRSSMFAGFSRKGNTLFIHVYFWPGSTVAIGGLKTKVQSARILSTGQKVSFNQETFRVKFEGLPVTAPVEPVSTLEVECAGEPEQDIWWIANERPR